MTIAASCPKGHKLKLDDKTAGKKIRCPRCQTPFTVPEPDDEDDDDRPRRRGRDEEGEDDDEDERPSRRGKRDDDDEDDEDDRPKKPKKKAKSKADEFDEDEIREGEEKLTPEERLKLRRKERKAQFSAVAFGLQLHFIKFIILLVAVCLGILGFVLGLAILGGLSVRPDQNADDFAFMMGMSIPEFVFKLALYTAIAIAPIVGIVGSFFCCFTPRAARTRVLVICSIVFDLIPVICSILELLFRNVWYDMDSGKFQRLMNYFELFSFVSTVLGLLYFLVYLRTLGAYIGMPGTGNEALNLIAFIVVQVLVAPVNFIMNLYAFRFLVSIDPYLALAVVILLIIGWIVFLYFFLLIGIINLLTKLRAGVMKKT